MNKIDYHFIGPLFEDHTVDLDILITTLNNLNRALSRSYLDVVRPHGVIKNAQMTKLEKENFIFTAELPLGQSWFQSVRAGTLNSERAVTRFLETILPPYERAKERGLEKSSNLAKEALDIQDNIKNESITPIPFEAFSNGNETNHFGEKSIAKYQSRMVSPMIHLGTDNNLELTIHTENVDHRLNFDSNTSKNFHSIISERSIGAPVVFRGNIKFIHSDKHSGDFYNTITHRMSRLKVISESDFLEIHPYTVGQEIEFIGSPVIEYGTIDKIAGDIYFIKFLRELSSD